MSFSVNKCCVFLHEWLLFFVFKLTIQSEYVLLHFNINKIFWVLLKDSFIYFDFLKCEIYTRHIYYTSNNMPLHHYTYYFMFYLDRWAFWAVIFIRKQTFYTFRYRHHILGSCNEQIGYIKRRCNRTITKNKCFL